MEVPETIPLPPVIQAPLDARKERLRAIFNRRSCTTLEMLTADFGHWPPKGLTITAPPEGPIEIVSALGGFRKRFEIYDRKDFNDFRRFAESRNWPAWTTTFFGKINRIENFIWMLKTAVQELTHKSMQAFIDGPSTHTGCIYINSLSLKFLSAAKAAELPDTISHETLHLLQRRTKKARLANMDGELKEIFTGLSADRFQDYGRQGEIQARLHSLLATMYQQAQGMPGDKKSFWTLLLGCGFFPQHKAVFNEIMDTITDNETGKGILCALAQQALLSRQFDEALYISILSNHMDEAGERKFWFDVLPRIYADLLVLYGDVETGKKITGPGPSP